MLSKLGYIIPYFLPIMLSIAHARIWEFSVAIIVCRSMLIYELTLDEQAVLEFLSSVIVDLCSPWTTN